MIYLSSEGIRELIIYVENPPIKCSYESCYFHIKLAELNYDLTSIYTPYCMLLSKKISTLNPRFCSKQFFLKQLLERI